MDSGGVWVVVLVEKDRALCLKNKSDTEVELHHYPFQLLYLDITKSWTPICTPCPS